jgi:FkbM family methyltransferase
MIKKIKTLIPVELKNKIKNYFKKFKSIGKDIKIIEHMEIDFMLSRLHKNKKISILEIGSHLGEIFNIILGNNFNQSFNIVCIEPNPDSFDKLKKKYTNKIKKFAKVTFYNIGISSVDNILPFYSPSKNSALFTLNKENLDKFELGNQKISVVDVETYKIETLLNEKKYIENYYDIIKIDAEGSDYQIANQIIDNSITFDSMMVELDESNLNLLSHVFNNLKSYSTYIFLRDGITTLTIEKINSVEMITNLINYNQKYANNLIAGNIIFVKDKYEVK